MLFQHNLLTIQVHRKIINKNKRQLNEQNHKKNATSSYLSEEMILLVKLHPEKPTETVDYQNNQR